MPVTSPPTENRNGRPTCALTPTVGRGRLIDSVSSAAAERRVAVPSRYFTSKMTPMRLSSVSIILY